MDAYIIGTTSKAISSGGTINGNLTISGDLTVSGGGALAFDEILEGTQVIDITNSEAFLVRKNGDSGDVFTVNTSTVGATLLGALTVGSDGSGHDVIFYSDTAGDNFTWDSSAEKLTITGTNGATALDIADGNLVVADSVDIEGDIDVNGTSNLDNTDIDGTLAVDGTTISLDATTSLNIDNSNTSNGITIATATSGVPISIGHATSETTVNDNLVVAGDIDLAGSIDVDGTANLDAVDIDGTLTQDAGNVVFNEAGADYDFRIESSANANAFFVDGAGFRSYMGHNSGVNIGGAARTLAIHNTSNDDTGGIQIMQWAGANSSQGNISFGKALGSSVGSYTVLTTGRPLGRIMWFGADGTDMANQAAELEVVANTVGSNDIGGDMLFKTSAGSGAAPSERMRIDEDGNVGIGDTDPSEAKLSIAGVASGDYAVKIDQDQATTALYIDIEGNASSIVLDAPQSTSAHCVDISTPANQDGHIFNIGEADTLTTGSAIRVDCGSANLASTASGGLVEILHDGASGGTANNLLFIKNDHASATGTTGIKIQQDANAYALDVRSKATSGASAGAKLRLHTDDTAVMASGDRLGVIEFAGAEDTSNTITVGARIEAITDATWSASENGAYMSFYTTDGNASQSEQMRIASTGYVGIGSTPSNRFHVQETLDEDLNIKFVGYASRAAHINLVADQASQNADWWRMTSDASGNYAIGSYSTGSWVNIFKLDSNSRMSLSNNDAGTDNTVFGKLAGAALADGSTYNVLIGDNAGNDLTVSDQNIAIGYATLDRATTQADGNVAIGYSAMHGNFTTANVDNCVAIGKFAIGNGTLTSDASGSVGVGYGALQELTSGQGNVAVGYQSLDACTDSDFNTAVGHNALTSMTGTAGITENTAVGNGAALNLTLGKGNTVVGRYALYTDDVGDYSTAIGVYSLYFQNSDSNNEVTGNTAVGYKSGHQNVTGTNNTYLGYRAGAGASGESNSNNTAVGKDALLAITTGDSNEVIGSGAGIALTTGADNVIIGTYAGDLMTTTSNCTLIGKNAGGAMSAGQTTTNGTICIGAQSGTSITSGARNFAIGFQALQDMTTGQDNMAIGYNAMLDANHAGFDYNTAIGNYSMDGAGAVACAYNTAVGYGTLSGTLTADADSNTAIGYEALLSVTSGAKNTAVGQSSGQNITTGDHNTAVGGESLLAHTTGEMNVALGFRALKTDQEGNQNTAVGYQALEGQNATADHGQNTAIGANAMAVAGDPRYCVAVGAEALAAGDVSTDGHVAIGYEALNDLVSGTENTAIGYQAAKDMTTGDDNTFIGYQSGLGTDAGGTPDGNTAVGRASLLALTTGSQNTCIGKNAGDAVTDGTENVFVGKNAGNDQQTGDSAVCIGPDTTTGNADRAQGVAIGHGISIGSDARVIVGNASNSASIDCSGSGNSWSTSSDVRIKKNVTDTDLGLSFINKLRPIKYQDLPSDEWDEDLVSPNQSKQMAAKYPSTIASEDIKEGLIAQEVKAVADELETTFSGWDDDGYGNRQSLQYERFVVPLIKAVQELSAKVEELEAKLK